MRTIVHVSPGRFGANGAFGGGERYPVNCAKGVARAAAGEIAVEVLSLDSGASEPASESGNWLRDPVFPGFGAWTHFRGDRHARFVAGTHSRASVRQVEPGVRLRSISSLWELPDALAGADLVHVHQAAMPASEVAIWVAKSLGKPVCVTDHGSITAGAGVCEERLDAADRVVCYSEYGASLLHTEAPVSIVKGGVDGTFFTPGPAQRERVLYAGRIVPYKGVDLLIEALPDGMPLTVCGRPYHGEYLDRLRRLAHGKRVEFVTDASDEQLRDYYRSAWATVLPTRHVDCYGNLQTAPELMGLALLESMACGTPAICSRVGAMPEFVRHGETGYVFDTVEELRGRLAGLRESADTVERLGSNGRAAVEEMYDSLVVGRSLAGLYAGLMA